MNHKRGKKKDARAGCLLCKPHKVQAVKKSRRQRARREAMQHEREANG